MKPGDNTSLRFYFAKIGVNERNRDVSPTVPVTIGIKGWGSAAIVH